MAITLLSQLETGVAGTGVSSAVVSVPLIAGSNRMLVVAVGTEVFSTAGVLPTVSYGGIPLSILQRADGALASISLTVPGFVDVIGVHFFGLLEADLRVAAHAILEAQWTSPGSSRQFMAGAWQLGNVEQSLIVRDFRRFNATGGTVLGGVTQPGGTSDAILVAGVNNTTTGTIQITIDGVGLAEDFDASLGGARFAGGNDLSAGAVAGIPFDMTFTEPATLRATVITGVRLAEHFPYGGSVGLLDEPNGSVTLEAL